MLLNLSLFLCPTPHLVRPQGPGEAGPRPAAAAAAGGVACGRGVGRGGPGGDRGRGRGSRSRAGCRALGPPEPAQRSVPAPAHAPLGASAREPPLSGKCPACAPGMGQRTSAPRPYLQVGRAKGVPDPAVPLRAPPGRRGCRGALRRWGSGSSRVLPAAPGAPGPQPSPGPSPPRPAAPAAAQFAAPRSFCVHSKVSPPSLRNSNGTPRPGTLVQPPNSGAGRSDPRWVSAAPGLRRAGLREDQSCSAETRVGAPAPHIGIFRGAVGRSRASGPAVPMAHGRIWWAVTLPTVLAEENSWPRG
jgi:hypothetical protein